MNRAEILEVINEIIETEHGVAVTENSLLEDAEIDSFAVLMVFLELDEKFEAFPKEKFETVEFKGLTIKDIIDIVEDKINESNWLFL